jgi:hypothetical protein
VVGGNERFGIRIQDIKFPPGSWVGCLSDIMSRISEPQMEMTRAKCESPKGLRDRDNVLYVEYKQTLGWWSRGRQSAEC